MAQRIAPGLDGYLAQRRDAALDQQTQLQAAQQMMGLQGLLMRQQQMQQEQAREQQFRQGIEALGPNPTQEGLAGIAAKYARPGELLRTQQSSLDRQATIDAARINKEAQISATREATRERIAAQIETAKQRGADQRALAEMNMQGRKELMQMAAGLRQQPESWGEPYAGPDGSMLQKSSRGQVRPVIGRAPKGAQSASMTPENAANIVATEGNKLLALIENDPRSAASILSPVKRGLEGVRGLVQSDYSGPALEAQAAKQRLIFAVDQLVKSGKSSNEFLRRLESSLGMSGVTTPGNATTAINEAIELTRQIGGGKTAPQAKKIKRTGTYNGRPVVEYEDGTVDYR